jgi:Protein of unknown function (DUF3800)
MLQAFIDDSTSNTGDKAFFLAGYINTVEMWEAFANVWDFALKQSPSIEYLKMSEAESLRGQFRGWSREERDAKIIKLAQVINLSRPHFVFCSVNGDEYIKIITPVAPQNLKNPYFMAFWGIIDSAARYLQNAGDILPVEFIFDDQGSMGDDAALFYQEMKKNLAPDLRAVLGNTPIFRDEKNLLPLQAADMLAWHVRRNHEKSSDEGRPAYKLITERGVGRHVERKHLVLMARKMKRIPGVEFVQSKADWKKGRIAIAELNKSGSMRYRSKFWMSYQVFKYNLFSWRAKMHRNK